MKDKFTFRDFIVYFFSGFVVMLYAFFNWHVCLLQYLFLHAALFKELAAFTILTLLLIGYLIGQILHSVDTLLYFVSTKLRRLNSNNVVIKAIVKPLLFLIGGHRVSVNLALKQNDEDSFWTDCARLQADNTYVYAEYWYVMNDLFKGLTLASMIFILISLVQLSWCLLAFYVVLSILFWLRSYYFALWFIKSVERGITVREGRNKQSSTN
jgi:hypothetical protein